MDPKYVLFTRKEFKLRHENLKEKLEKLDRSFIFNRADLFYYTGIGLDGVLEVTENLHYYVRRNLELAREESVLPTDMMNSFRLFKKLGKENNINTLGLELDLIPHKTAAYIKNAFGNPKLVDIGHDLRLIRSVKSLEEQEYMLKAAKQTDESFEYIREKIKPGVTELELSADIEYFLRRNGHPGFVNVRMFHHNLTTLAYVMAGESTSTLNTAFGPVSGQGLCKMHKNGPSERKIKLDDAVLIDTTGAVEGYTADETRTFFVGTPDEKLKDALEIAKQVQEKTQQILKAGVQPSQIYEKLNQLVNESGFGNNFMGLGEDKVQFTGHGIGLELDEYPIITPKYEQKLEKGNIVAMEPKFIFKQPSGGVGIENSWIVGENGAKNITLFPWK